MSDADAVTYYNKRLAQMHAGWRVTPENQCQLFGTMMTNIYASGHAGGIRIIGGCGLVVDQSTIKGAEMPVWETDSSHNRITHSELDPAPPDRPPPVDSDPPPMRPYIEPKECQD